MFTDIVLSIITKFYNGYNYFKSKEKAEAKAKRHY